MKKTGLLLMVVAMFLSSAVAFAQNLNVTGVITDATNGEPIPFASIRLKDTMNGTSADADGIYSISVPSKGVLVFSFVGYADAEVPVNGNSVVNCKLEPDANVLDDVVVVGYGSAKKVGSLVGSISTVKSDKLKNSPSSSALDQLQGQVAGLSVMTTGGNAGESNVSMSIHGIGSLGSSPEPLYIIDGIQATSRSVMSMNPNDILSVTVLKDASATSIYGSRAANGVVFITTKAGSYDSKSTVTIRSQAGISTLADMTLYKNMMSGSELKDFWVRAGIHTPEYIKTTYTDKGYDANTQWYKYFQQLNNPQFQNDITIEGGGKKVAYMIGASQFHQRGTAVGNYYDRYTFRSNVQGHPKDWLKVGANVSLSWDTNQQNPFWGGSSSQSNSVRGGMSYLNNPLFPAIDPNTGKEYETTYPNGVTNPHWYSKNRTDVGDRYGLLGNVNVEIEPFKNFKIASRSGIDGYVLFQNYKSKPSFEMSGGSGERVRQVAMEYTASITNTLEYKFEINENHQFTVLAGHEGIANIYDYTYAGSSGQKDDRLLNLQDGVQSNFSVTESYIESKFLSFFGHADYTLFGKYIIDATVRNDASSRFGADNRNAQFWSAGVLWKAKRENFLKDVWWLDDFNVRTSYGTQGNAAIDDYQSLALIGTTTNYAGGASMVVTQPSNPKLTWEKQSLFSVGISGRVVDHVDFNIEYYNRRTSSMLMSVPYPYTTGFSELVDNVGGLSNSGVDITLGVDILRGRDYFLRFNTTFSYNKEKVTKLFDGRKRWDIANTGITYVVGSPVMFYAPIYAGVDPEDGQMMWYLPGEDTDKTCKDKNRTTKVFDEATLTQNTGKRFNPPVNGGFGLSGAWKGLSFVADFSYVLGKTLINNDAYFYKNPNQFSTLNTSKAVSDFWTPENKNAKYPDWSTGAIMQFDSHIHENASFLRLKNLQVGYNFPEKWFSGQNVLSAVKVTLTGRNLFTVTKYTGIDPEVDGNLTYGRTGNSRQYLFGIELTF